MPYLLKRVLPRYYALPQMRLKVPVFLAFYTIPGAANCRPRTTNRSGRDPAPAQYNGVMRILLASLLSLGLLSAGEIKVGKPVATSEPMTLETLLAKPGNYVGKTVAVKGKISAVCQEMGCWMELTNDGGQRLKIQVPHGSLEFPKDGAGKMAIAEGKLTKSELTREQAIETAKEEAKDRGQSFDPSSVKGPVTVYQIEGSGAIILTN